MYRAAGLEDTVVRRIARGAENLVAHFSVGLSNRRVPGHPRMTGSRGLADGNGWVCLLQKGQGW
jgi:hypothetical protein